MYRYIYPDIRTIACGASVFGAGGGLGQAALAALGPIALIGVPLLVGARTAHAE